MRRTCILLLLNVLWLSSISVARADDSTPVPQATSPPVVVVPTPPPVVPTPAPVPQSQPTIAPESSPVPVAPEATHAAAQATEPAVAVPTSSVGVSGNQPVAQENSPTALQPTTSAKAPQGRAHTSGTSTAAASAPPTGANLDVPQASSLPPYYTAGTSGSYAAPAQLVCHGTKNDAPGPFLSSPYSGWADINSFVDHDSPDYSVDGTIVIANGIRATSAGGQADDYFPAYWSDALRQYISYDGHNGYDFGISYQPVLAAAGGTVQYAGWNGDGPSVGYGQMVLIDHHNGYITLYGHLSKLEVKDGDKVQAGEEIGISGNTGNSTGPHLHFSVFHNCQVTDPYGWTGRGHDPLRDFDDERASYLWLPGQDPLVLNPPPDWPSFPDGLSVPRVFSSNGAPRVERTVPPAVRLLLLKLPSTDGSKPVSPAVALARTDTLMTEEAETLAPYLDDLKAEGMIESYQVIPAAGAIWVRGTASAPQLESLPGIASLTGAGERDLLEAQAGLAHNVLVQMAAQEAPSLWPVGFRSAGHTWRPVVDIAAGHALVAGFALPGEKVTVSLLNGKKLLGAAQTLADPVSGGFVATVHDTSGAPVPAASGDVVDVRSAGRSVQVRVPSFTLRAREHSVKGVGPAGSMVAVTTVDLATGHLWKAVTINDRAGRFALKTREALTGGTLAVVDTVDSAGDQEAATASVPAVVLTEGSAVVRGWTVSSAPRLVVSRSGRTIFSSRIYPAPDGAFQLRMEHHGEPLTLRQGDRVGIGSRWHTRYITLPPLSVSRKGRSLVVRGPREGRVTVSMRTASGRKWVRTAPAGAARRKGVAWPAGPTGAGESGSVQLSLRSGDVVRAYCEITSLAIHEGDSLVGGRATPGEVLSIRVDLPDGRRAGSAVATADAGSGSFLTPIRDAVGDPIVLLPGMRLTLESETTVRRLIAPAVSLTWNRPARTIQVRVPPGTRTALTLKVGRRLQVLNPVRAASGVLTTSVGAMLPGRAGLLRVTASFQGHLTVTRQEELSTAVPRSVKAHGKRAGKQKQARP